MEDKALISLACIDVGCSGFVSDINGWHGLSICLNSLGIIPGKRITRITPVPIRGPITIEMDKVQVVIGFGMAARILLKVKENVCNH
jgi:ferrous iron transport protein A